MKRLIYPIVFALMVTYSEGKRKTIERDECGAFELWACGCYPVFPEEDGIINARRLLPFWDFKRRYGGPRPSPSRTRPGKNNATALEQRATIVTGEQEIVPSEQPPAMEEAEKSATAETPVEASKPPAAATETPTTPEKPTVAAQTTAAAPQTPPPTEKAPEKAETPAPPPSK